MAVAPALRCGPSGWSHPQWNSMVYPRPTPRNFHPLEYLSKYFDLAEISSSFQEPLKPEVSRLWLRKVEANPNFRFTAKLHRQFTHERSLDESGIARFKDGLKPILRAGKLGVLLMQFPWSFRFTQENKEFLIRLRRAFHEFPLAAEMRHESWMRDEALGVFIDYRVGFCNIDQPQFTKSMPPTAFLTSGIAVVRLHGRNCFQWFREYPEHGPVKHRYDYLYSAAELEEWKNRIQHLQKYASATYVITNNDMGAKSVVNALQLQSLLNIGKPDLPAEVKRTFGIELKDYYPKKPIQNPLFREFATHSEDRRAVA